MTTYYLDGTTLSNSTTIYSDAAMTTAAADGYYSDGIISRQAVGGVLYAPTTCLECLAQCGETIILSEGNTGYYMIEYNVGAATGAIGIKFTPIRAADGIFVEYDGNFYNSLSSINGLSAASDVDVPNYVGNTASTCSFHMVDLDNYEYIGGDIVSAEGRTTITPLISDVHLYDNDTSYFMVIPKTAATPDTLMVNIASPCDSDWEITVYCPEELTGYTSTMRAGTEGGVIGLELNQTYYNYPVTGTAGAPSSYDWVFSDINGATVLSDGFYGLSGGAIIQVQDGIIIHKT